MMSPTQDERQICECHSSKQQVEKAPTSWAFFQAVKNFSPVKLRLIPVPPRQRASWMNGTGGSTS